MFAESCDIKLKNSCIFPIEYLKYKANIMHGLINNVTFGMRVALTNATHLQKKSSSL